MKKYLVKYWEQDLIWSYKEAYVYVKDEETLTKENVEGYLHTADNISEEVAWETSEHNAYDLKDLHIEEV